MAENDKPEGLDEFLASEPTSEDPKTERAASGLNTVLNTPIVQQALNVGNNLDQYGAMVNAAMAGDANAMQALSQHSLGTAMGSLKSVPSTPGNPGIKVIDTEPVSAFRGAIKQIDTAAAPTYGKIKVVEDLSQPKETYTGPIRLNAQTPENIGSVTRIQDLDSEPSNFGKTIIKDQQNPTPNFGKVIVKPYAEGGSIDPEGLDQFIAQPPTNQMQQPQVDNTPPGLDDFIKDEANQEKYGSTSQQALAGIEGAAKGLAGPIATGAERALSEAGIPGLTPEDQRGREEANPFTHYGTEAVGLIAPALLTGGASLGAKAGVEGAAAALPALKAIEGASLGGVLSRIGETVAPNLGEGVLAKSASGIIRGAIENMAYQSGDEMSKAIMQDPHQDTASVAADLGIAGLAGGALGGALGSVSPLWKAASETKVGQELANFKGQLLNRIDNPEPVKALTQELADHYEGVKSIADETYGPAGIKAQEISKLMPEMSQKIIDQSGDIISELESSANKLEAKGDPLARKLRDQIDTIKSAVDFQRDPITLNPTKTPTSEDVFNSIQGVKQQLQEYSKFNKNLAPIAERDFIDTAKGLAHDLRTSLEDPAVWGKAAERQQSINKAFSEYLPKLKDFESKFTTKIEGEKTLDPTKVAAYYNQLGKPSAEIKQGMLKSFLDSSEKFVKTINDSHANLGIESPFTPTPLNHARATLNEITPMARLANWIADKGLSNAAGEGLGAAIGSKFGHKVGLGDVGALIGAHALGPSFAKILPFMARSVLGAANKASSMKVASDFLHSALKGDGLINKGAKTVFKTGAQVIAGAQLPTQSDRDRIDKKLQALQNNPKPMMDIGQGLSHYLPGHAAATAQNSTSVINYLNSQRPVDSRLSPLDTAIKPSSSQKAEYNKTLDLAQKPLIVLDKIKSGTITPKDIKDISTMYPALYQKLSQKLTDEMISHQAKGESIPYKTRIALSMFLAQPLDSTMKPEAILSAQPKPQQNQQSNNTKPRVSGASTKALNKFASSYRTPAQAREQRQETKQ